MWEKFSSYLMAQIKSIQRIWKKMVLHVHAVNNMFRYNFTN